MTKRSYIILFFLLLVIKVLCSIFIKEFWGGQVFGGGNDSDYYDSYALGYTDDAVNLWPVILRWLNSFSLYSREVLSWILSFLGFIAIPVLTSRLIINKSPYSYQDKKDYWLVMVIVSLYPSLYFQTLDIYRDVFMMVLFLFFLTCCRVLFERFSLRILFFAFCLIYILFGLRGYLGAACLITLIFSPLYSLRKFPLILSIIIYFISMQSFFHVGLLDSILYDYRLRFDIVEGGASLNIRFTDGLTFLPNFMRSIIYQLPGIYFPNFTSVLVFFIEGGVFIYAFIYILKNRYFANSFVSFLILFSMVYMTVWILGNDNLGTAIRLRMFNYICILISFFIIKRNKRLYCSGKLISQSSISGKI